MRETVGATSLHYLSLQDAGGDALPEDAVCRACFPRDYPTRVPAARNQAKLRFSRRARRGDPGRRAGQARPLRAPSAGGASTTP